MSVLIGASVLCVSGCGSSRRVVTSEVRGRMAEVRVDSVVQSALVEARDSVVERTTITIQTSEGGDTLFTSVVTERDRVSSRDNRAAVRMKTEVRIDTLYVERRDSVLVKNSNQARASPLLMNLKWIFWIVLGLIALVVVLRVRRL